MKHNRARAFFAAAFAATAIFLALFCSNPSSSDEEAVTYTVAYDDNGADSGSAPTDSAKYEAGGTVKILDNTGSLMKDGYYFAGWSYGSKTCAEGDAIIIGRSAITLVASWTVVAPTITSSGSFTCDQSGDLT